jgi:hypothetical protein
MKVSMLGVAKLLDDGTVTVPIEIGKPPKVRVVDIPLPPEDLPPEGWAAVAGSCEPHRVATLSGAGRERYLFRGKVVQATDIGHLSETSGFNISHKMRNRASCCRRGKSSRFGLF